MKNVILSSLAVLSIALFSSCKKDEDVVYGNTNIVSKTMTVYASQWVFLDPEYYVDIAMPEINQSILTNGAVMVYKKNIYDEWEALPNTTPIDGNYSEVYTFSIWNGYLTLYKTDTDLLTLSPDDMEIKVVILSLKSMLQNTDVNWNNYSEVSQRFNLK